MRGERRRTTFGDKGVLHGDVDAVSVDNGRVQCVVHLLKHIAEECGDALLPVTR